MANDDRFRNASRYAGSQGFVGGFSNFHEADYGRGVVYSTLMLPASTVEWRDIPRAQLAAPDPGATDIRNVAAVVRAVSRHRTYGPAELTSCAGVRCHLPTA
jgi:hypothetical protein